MTNENENVEIKIVVDRPTANDNITYTLVVAAQVWRLQYGRPRVSKRPRADKGQKRGLEPGSMADFHQKRARTLHLAVRGQPVDSIDHVQRHSAAKGHAHLHEKNEKDMVFNKNKARVSFLEDLRAGRLLPSEYQARIGCPSPDDMCMHTYIYGLTPLPPTS